MRCFVRSIRRAARWIRRLRARVRRLEEPPAAATTLVTAIEFGEDLDQAARLIVACARAHPAVLEDPAPRALPRVDLCEVELVFWVQRPAHIEATASDLRFAVADAFSRFDLTLCPPRGPRLMQVMAH